jgi:hypothetical protein
LLIIELVGVVLVAAGYIQGCFSNINANKPSEFHSFCSLSENAMADCIEKLIPLISLKLIILNGPISIQKHEVKAPLETVAIINA